MRAALQTYKEVRENHSSQTYLKCLENHTIKYTDGRGKPQVRNFRKGTKVKRVRIKVLRPLKWKIAYQ
jgi:hypothetical protein